MPVDRLRSCPFCGAEVELSRSCGGLFVACPTEGCFMHEREFNPGRAQICDTEEFIEKWNRRPE